MGGGGQEGAPHLWKGILIFYPFFLLEHSRGGGLSVVSYYRYCSRYCPPMMAGVGLAYKLLKKTNTNL